MLRPLVLALTLGGLVAPVRADTDWTVYSGPSTTFVELAWGARR